MKSAHLAGQFSLQDSNNDVVFLDIAIADVPQGRLCLELFGRSKTTENFRQLCTGEYRLGNTPQGYKNSVFHRVTEGLIFCGDYLNADGTGNLSIYGQGFAAEPNGIKHEGPGLLTASLVDGLQTC